MSTVEAASNADRVPNGSIDSSGGVAKKRRSKNEPSFFTNAYNTIVAFIQATFGYRKTSLSLFVVVTLVVVAALSAVDNDLDWSVKLPSKRSELGLLDKSWSDLQQIDRFKHPYGSEGNAFVHDYLQERIQSIIRHNASFEFDNDLNNTNRILIESSPNVVAYYESNNLLVRINGTDPDLPGLLISAHYDSVPSSYGVTDDGMGIASMLGVLRHFAKSDPPLRTVVFNFNNNEEFGLYGASAFLNHPWSKDVKYFINLEGTGAGGKAILFRGTDYAITKEYSAVRYPFASSIFQQAFKRRIIHSETDYKIYYEDGGMRGIDIAFYKPRDIYHTGLDNIKNIDKKALWHMLSSALDFVTNAAHNQLDIDAEYLDKDSEIRVDDSGFVTFWNFFYILPLSKIRQLNIALVVVVPVVSLAFLIIVFGLKKNWELGFVNTIKYPVSLLLSVLALQQINYNGLALINSFLPNSAPLLIAFTLFSVFLLLNYFILNGINLLFRRYKIVQHDEKLVVILQTSFIYWIILIVSTAGMAYDTPGENHSGEGLLTILFGIQAVGALWGILGWCLKQPKGGVKTYVHESSRSLLAQENTGYGAADFENNDGGAANPDIDDSSFSSIESDFDYHKASLLQRSFSYDWSIQFLILVPVSVLIVYNSGFLILSGVNKSIQESYSSEQLIYKLIQWFAIAWGLPFLPFIFKVNRFIVLLLVFFVVQNLILISLRHPFDQENPLKLRFIQTADLTFSKAASYVKVSGRHGAPFYDVLTDVPSVKKSGELVSCTLPQDGMTQCSYKTELSPLVVSGAKDFSDYLQVKILRNSSSNDYPFGMLTGEISINAPGSGMCSIKFDPTQTTAKPPSEYPKDIPVKTVTIYQDVDTNKTSSVLSIPEGFSQDKNGNFLYKKVSGITGLELNHLNNDEPYHLGFQWVPNFLDAKKEASPTNSLQVRVECYWSDLGVDNKLVPAYQELNKFSPNYVSWANLNRGMVSVVDEFEI